MPHLNRLWRAHRSRRLVEPFCGGLAVALGLQPRRALLNDVNPHLINFYRQVRDGLITELPMANARALYYAHRRRFNELLARGETASAEAAALFYYLNRTGYNGLCRFNKSGEFNVPFGKFDRINYRSSFLDYQPVLARWEFTNVSFEDLEIDPDDFVYADPPYDVEFTQYSRGGFRWDDQVRAAEWLARHPGPVVLSNQATPRIIDLYERLGFTLKFLKAPRRIACTGDRAPAREVLATRNLGRSSATPPGTARPATGRA